MKILYGIQTTGNGHICRSEEIIKSLRAMGHDVRILFSGKDSHRMKGQDVFRPSQIFRGLTFQTRQGRLRPIKTLLDLRPVAFYRELSGVDAAGFDLIITDYEPITARLARRFHIPCIGIGHQYAFFSRIPIASSGLPTLWILKRFAACDIPLGLHWHHFGCPVLPPIVPEGLKTASKTIAEKILVYLPFEDLETIQSFLRFFDAFRFYIYGISTLKTPRRFHNLYFLPFSRAGLLKDLSECSGVLCNAGFELVSEALHIGKKILAKPLRGQIEQESNALALEHLKLGQVMKTLDRRRIETWLSAPSIPAMKYPNVARMIAQWIHEGRWEDTHALATRAWALNGTLPPSPAV